MKVVGDLKDTNGDFRTETLELWHRDPLECVAELLGNPSFAEYQRYAPERVFRQQTNGVPSNREYSEMWSADWWWETQEQLPEGATIAPVIIASDETQLSTFSSEKKAWLVYLTIGNIAKSERRKPTSRAWILLGYIPVSKLACYSKNERSAAGCQLFYDCMRKILEPLILKGLDPTEIGCADGFLRNVHAILAAYIADYPEQCRVACCRENSCPKCTVAPKERGEPGPLNSVYRDPDEIISIFNKQANGDAPSEFVDLNLRPVYPFWQDLPLCNIFECITPDILHQLHKGAFSDHVSKWAIQTVNNGVDEIDARYKAMSTHPTLRHFDKGISEVTQWTGGEYRAMAKVFPTMLAGIADPGVIRAVCALEDFMYYAHFETHCDETLEAMHTAWQIFHREKSVFLDLAVRKHFNISKIHNLKHYIECICSRGTNNNFNSKTSERLHIDLAKAGYRASNRRAFMVQMTTWLERQEAVQRFAAYLQWAVDGYVAETAGLDEQEDDEDEEEEESGVPAAADGKESEQDDGEVEATTYRVAKKPALHVTISSIETDYQADWFLWYLNNFVDDHSLIPPGKDSGLTNDTLIPVYKQVRLKLPLIPEAASEKHVDIVYALKKQPARLTSRGLKPLQPAKTSTVLIQMAENNPREGPMHGIQAARVLLIFQLPPSLGTYKHPLAFVHLFKPFKKPVPDLNLFQTSYATRQHAKHGAIIPISQIMQSCHLTPHFGRGIDPRWTSSNVLDVAPSFYLNAYLRYRDFYLLHHRVYLHQKAKEDRHREVQRIRARRAPGT